LAGGHDALRALAILVIGSVQAGQAVSINKSFAQRTVWAKAVGSASAADVIEKDSGSSACLTT